MNQLIILGFMGLGATELIVILVVVLLLFGGRKIPELMKGLGKASKISRMLLKALTIPRLRKKTSSVLGTI